MTDVVFDVAKGNAPSKFTMTRSAISRMIRNRKDTVEFLKTDMIRQWVAERVSDPKEAWCYNVKMLLDLIDEWAIEEAGDYADISTRRASIIDNDRRLLAYLDQHEIHTIPDLLSFGTDKIDWGYDPDDGNHWRWRSPWAMAAWKLAHPTWQPNVEFPDTEIDVLWEVRGQANDLLRQVHEGEAPAPEAPSVSMGESIAVEFGGKAKRDDEFDPWGLAESPPVKGSMMKLNIR